jgi:hypothetical protein
VQLCRRLFVIVLASATLVGSTHNSTPLARALSVAEPYRLNSGDRRGLRQDTLTSSYAARADSETDVCSVVEINFELRVGQSGGRNTCWLPDWSIRTNDPTKGPRRSSLAARASVISDKSGGTLQESASRSGSSPMVILSHPARHCPMLCSVRKLVKAACRKGRVASRSCAPLQPASAAAQPAVIVPWIRTIADLASLLRWGVQVQNSSIGDSTRLGALY